MSVFIPPSGNILGQKIVFIADMRYPTILFYKDKAIQEQWRRVGLIKWALLYMRYLTLKCGGGWCEMRWADVHTN